MNTIKNHYKNIIFSVVFLFLLLWLFRVIEHPCDPRELAIHNNSGTVVSTFFLPEDQQIVKRTLLHIISQEKRSICVACYRFTHPAYARALMHAYERGVRVTIIADEGYERCSESMISLMKRSGITVYVYHCPVDMRYSLMHNKYMIFGQQSLVWTGSFNFTRSALTANHENVVLLSGLCVERYTQNFSSLLDNCSVL